MNQHAAFASICPLLYNHLCTLQGDEKEYFRELVNKPYQDLGSLALMFAYGNLRAHLSLMRRDDQIPIRTYLSLVQESNSLYMQSFGVC
jgi:hypothetical protein